MHKRSRAVVGVAIVAGMLAAACGGGSKKPTATGQSATTLTSSADTSTTFESTSTTAAGTTASSAVAAPTATTAKRVTTATTAKKATSSLSRVTTPPPTVAGIAQVTTTASTAPSEPVQPGGTVTVELSAEGNGFDPSFSTGSIGGTDPQKLFAVYDGLVYQDGKSGSVVPQTAASVTTTDAVTWLLKVRPGIKFTDGSDYNAAAIKFNWDRCQQPELACSQAPALKTWNYSVQDALTLKVVLPAANGQWPRIISIGGGGLSAVASPAWLQGKSRADVLNSDPVGAGPFVVKLKDWVKDSSLTMNRNANYWNAPKPYVDRLVWRPVTDDQQRVNSFKAGEAEMIYLSNPPLVADLQKSSPVASVPSINSYIYFFNTGRVPFNDVNIRKAMILSVDRDQINKTVLGGVLDTPVGFFPPNYPYSDTSLNFPAQDLTQAQALVDDWIAKKNNGNDLTFTISSSNSTLGVATIQLLQQQWQRLKHVTVKLNVVSTVQVTNDLRAANFDVVGTTVTGVDPEPQFFQQAGTGGARGPVYTGFSDGAIDKAIADSRAAIDANARNQALKAFQQALNNNPPFLIAYRNPTFYGYKSTMKDLAYFDEGGILSDRFWIKTH